MDAVETGLVSDSRDPLVVTGTMRVRSLNGMAGGWLDKHQRDELLSPGAPGAH